VKKEKSLKKETRTETRAACGEAGVKMDGLIDTHAHLTFPDFDSDRQKVILRAWEAGLLCIINIGSGEGLDGNEKALALAQGESDIWTTVGVHPHDAANLPANWIEKIAGWAGYEKAVAIGEIGLDFYRDKAPQDIQIDCFRKLLRLAHEKDLPVVIHSRDANEKMWKILNEEGIPERGGVFHCFSGDVRFAEKIVSAGFHISVPGIVTFDKAQILREVVAAVPLEKILLETDCPYLAPEPHRGKRNEPAYVRYVAEKIAEIKGLSFKDVARITTLAAKRLFGLPGAELVPQIAYQIRNSLYLNITNQCTLACTFCPKHTDYEVKGHYLKLTHEPNIEEIFQAMGHPEDYDEVVFCGYGEPTRRLEVVKLIAARMKERGVKRVRLNTDGLANLIYRRNIAEELKGIIDAVSISVNAPDAKTYATICPSVYGEDAYAEVINFVRECRKYIPEVVITAVALPEISIESMLRLAEELGVKLRMREHMNLG
jgi:TatD DNase family protein